MGTPDVVTGILEPYINGFELWESTGRLYQSGDAVPAVGLATSYSIQLQAPPETRDVILQVQEGRISNVMALQPLEKRSVFDPRGRYLGTGGSKLEPLSVLPLKPPVDLVTAVRQMSSVPEVETTVPVASEANTEELSPSVEEAPPEQTEKEVSQPRMTMVEHKFHLRPGFVIQLSLPDNLTKHEADRLADFFRCLPFAPEPTSRY